jgi:hypothetical protein
VVLLNLISESFPGLITPTWWLYNKLMIYDHSEVMYVIISEGNI